MSTVAAALPDAVYVWANPHDAPSTAHNDAGGSWSVNHIGILLDETASALRVRASAPRSGLSRVALRWSTGVAENSLILGDAWERSYGDLGWQHIRPERILPWYWLATSPGQATIGAGVRVRPGAMCFWTVDVDGVTLWLDVRSGNSPVILGDRLLEVASIVALDVSGDVAPFIAHRELCAALCSDAIPSPTPIVGCNNWYYAYGMNFDADTVMRDAEMIVDAAQGHPVRPYCVIDAGWSKGTGGAPGGPWEAGAGSFSDMETIAARIRGHGARPGLWIRPLLTSNRSGLTRDVMLDGEWPLDPSRGEVLAQVAQDIRRVAEWGFDLIKHDFSTFDTIGHFVPGTELGMDTVPWKFADESRTTAEVIVDLYTVIADAAGDSTVIGCNTIGHLAAGLVAVQRTGDDTSGRQWERTRRMGVNTIAFRLAQHNAFFTVDADCVASTPLVPWDKTSQFLDLVASSGTALFVSIDPATHDSVVDEALRRAVRVALDGGSLGGIEPLDWQLSSAPRRWRIDGEERDFQWGTPWGVDQSLASI